MSRPASVRARPETVPAGLTSATPPDPDERLEAAGEGHDYEIGQRVERAAATRPYERQEGDPPVRPLRIFALDPSASRRDGAVAIVEVPYEPIEPAPAPEHGFRGRLFTIDPRDGGNGLAYEPLDLDDRTLLLQDGCSPSPSDPRFHQQMVYAVCSAVYALFRSALGRDLAWGHQNGSGRLRVRPYAERVENAYYDRQAGELAFGYFDAHQGGTVATPPGGLVFTSLSHDVVAHEVTHAILDGLRADFADPTGPDVLAFHEGLADLVAIFQRFRYAAVVEAAINRSWGRLKEADLLTGLARQFGQTTGAGETLRRAIDAHSGGSSMVYRPDLEAHALGGVLLLAVFDAFRTVYERKTERYVRLGAAAPRLRVAGLHPDLAAILAERASDLARQFLTMCIRAIDYCPPVDVELGEFLRAVITADRDLVPDDPWGYREAWIEAFRQRRIYPPGVRFLTEDALLWRPPDRRIAPFPSLAFARLRFDGDPGHAAGPAELSRQARALGFQVSRPENLPCFGLVRAGDPRLGGDPVTRPCVESVRSLRRVGPDGQVDFDLVAEVTQRRRIRDGGDGVSFDFTGGSTVIIGPTGQVRYVVSKSVVNAERLERQRQYMLSPEGRRLWIRQADRLVPAPTPFKLLHEPSGKPVDG